MDAQTWVIGQIIIDVIMVSVLLWFLRLYSRGQLSWKNHTAVLNKSEELLSDMRHISDDLERNLREKKEISRSILEQLDRSLRRAEESYRQLSKIASVSGAGFIKEASLEADDADQLRSSVTSLLDIGLPKEEIARDLGVSIGEIDLLIRLGGTKGAV
jgi:hypothetical protein